MRMGWVMDGRLKLSQLSENKAYWTLFPTRATSLITRFTFLARRPFLKFSYTSTFPFPLIPSTSFFFQQPIHHNTKLFKILHIPDFKSISLQVPTIYAIAASLLCLLIATLLLSAPRRNAIIAPTLDLSPRKQIQRWRFDAAGMIQEYYSKVCHRLTFPRLSFTYLDIPST